MLSYRLKDNTLHSVEIIPKPTNDEAELQRLLLTWKENLKRSKLPFVMGYLLQHQYKDVDLSYNELKGRDKEVVSYLLEACGVAGFYLYLAKLESVPSGDRDDATIIVDDHGKTQTFWEEHERWVFLDKIVDLDGSEVGEGNSFGDPHFTTSEDFQGKSAGHEEYLGISLAGIRQRIVSSIPKFSP